MGLDNPNAIAYGPDGTLYVGCGAVGRAGTILKLDGVTGEVLGQLVPGENTPISLTPITDLTFAEGALFAASCDDGRVLKLDATTGTWLADVARGTPGGVTQIAVREGRVLYTDFHRNAIGAADLLAGTDLGLVTRKEGFAPWGIALGPSGHIFWSGGDRTIQRYDPAAGANETRAGPTAQLTISSRLALPPDGRLACSAFAASAITVWDTTTPRRLLLVVRGEKVRG